MIEYIVIVGFFYSIALFFGLLKIWDLNQELKRLEREEFMSYMREAYGDGYVRGFDMALEELEQI